MLQRVRGGVFKAGETGPKSELVLGDWVEQFPRHHHHPIHVYPEPVNVMSLGKWVFAAVTR